MLESGQPKLKRRVSDSAELDLGETTEAKRSRYEERASSLPNGYNFNAAGYSLGSSYSLPQTSNSAQQSPVSYVSNDQPFASPYFNAGGRDMSGNLNVSPYQHADSAWTAQSFPTSESSEQTMEEMPLNALQTPQSTAAKQDLQAAGMPVDMQRSSSAPDLRVLIEGQINPPPPTNRLPPLGSNSMMGAIVPFKAPRDVIRDAVFHELRKHVQGALEEKPTNFDFAAGGVCANSNSAFDRDKMERHHIEICSIADFPEPEPMDTAEG